MLRAKAIAVAAAIAFVGAVGSASAAEGFSALNGVPAEPLTAAEMASIKGSELFEIKIFGPVNDIWRELSFISNNHHIGVVHSAPGQGAKVNHSQRGRGNNNGKKNN